MVFLVSSSAWVSESPLLGSADGPNLSTRRNSHHTLPQGCRGRGGCAEARQEVERPHPQFQRQPVLLEQPAVLIPRDGNVAAGVDRPRPQCTSTRWPRGSVVANEKQVDLTPMLSHSITYQSLVHDVLDMKLNRITVETPVDESNPAKGVTKKAYDVSANDFFWQKNAGVPFPEVAGKAIPSSLAMRHGGLLTSKQRTSTSSSPNTRTTRRPSRQGRA